MAEMDQDNKRDNDDADFDDELASLSADEKAAFEKIMAEINAASGPPEEPTGDASEKPPLKADTNAKDGSGSEMASDSADVSSPSDDVDISPPMKPEEPQSTSNAMTDSGAGGNDALSGDAPSDTPDELDADQQAALDRIMAEIKSKSEGHASGDEKSNIGKSTEGEELSEDQQAALDAIMAEIDAKRKTETIDSENQTEKNNNGDDDLSEDQQAALDAIMAEISSKRQKDTTEEEKSVSENDSVDDNLSEDQQAALDAIMAEISSKRQKDTTEEEKPASENDSGDDNLSEDQQAALDAIMADINAKKRKDEVSYAADSGEEEDAGNKGLTIEEFDDELSNLLTEATPEASSSDMKKAPLDEPSVPIDDPTQEITERKSTAPETRTESYPILQEIHPEDETIQKKSNRRSFLWQGGKRIAAVIAIAACLIISGLYLLDRYDIRPKSALINASSNSQVDLPAKPMTVAENHLAETLPAPVGNENESIKNMASVSETPVDVDPESGFISLKQNLSKAREQIQTKINDIEQLKSYYARGIEEEKDKIEQTLEHGRIPPFSEAMNDKKIELALRAIQRRKTYISKLDAPNAQLTAMAEELLYLERKTDTFDILSAGIHGLPIDDFVQKAQTALKSYMQYNTQLSIDQVEVPAVQLASIWAEISTEIGQRANLLAQRAPLNRAISKEICQGNYDRKYQLTAMSAETARCLVKWPGKDLYLNSLSELPPDVAEILAQWPGEWISLNGLKDLPVESAKQLAAWPGKRLSLNGLTRLSPEVTAHLSRWRGEQLELVGLHAIGPWENYGTRLFLSEKLRRQLEAQ